MIRLDQVVDSNTGRPYGGNGSNAFKQDSMVKVTRVSKELIGKIQAFATYRRPTASAFFAVLSNGILDHSNSLPGSSTLSSRPYAGY
jgi:hypothetical protein